MSSNNERLEKIQNKYPKVAQFIEETNISEQVDRVMWVNSLDKNDFAVLLNEILFKIGSGSSGSVELRKNAKRSKNFYYNLATDSTHLFARHEALASLGLSQEDIKKLFPQVFPADPNQTKIDL
ncbi:hypothetical protein [Niallia taxi]|uniref:hypothetical protein n=1 Tax=Niallia taxi TaxID=2499688 RepID=UPI0015F35FB1|nr:hypothetical protein [Niallia taxi]